MKLKKGDKVKWKPDGEGVIIGFEASYIGAGYAVVNVTKGSNKGEAITIQQERLLKIGAKIKHWIITGERFGPKVDKTFKTKQAAETWLDGWAAEWKAAGSRQDPRDFYSAEPVYG